MNKQTKKTLAAIFQNTSFTVFRELFECTLFKRVIRIEANLKDIPTVKVWISKLNLEYSIGNKIFKPVIDKGMDSWSSTLMRCSKTDSAAMCFVYANSDKSKCDAARKFDENGDDSNFGWLLNYPPCCVKSFLSWNKKNEHDPISMITDSFKISSDLHTYNFPNPFLSYIGVSLYSHFPCSISCIRTKTITLKKMMALKLNFPFAFNDINKFKNSLVLFKPGNGICIWTNFKVRNEIVKLSTLNHYGQGQLKNICKEVYEIKLSDKELILQSNNNSVTHIASDRLFFGAFNFPKVNEPANSSRPNF